MARAQRVGETLIVVQGQTSLPKSAVLSCGFWHYGQTFDDVDAVIVAPVFEFRLLPLHAAMYAVRRTSQPEAGVWYSGGQ